MQTETPDEQVDNWINIEGCFHNNQSCQSKNDTVPSAAGQCSNAAPAGKQIVMEWVCWQYGLSTFHSLT